MKTNALRVQRLHRINPHCHWCGKKTVIYCQDGGKLPDDAATYDHVYSRFDPRRTPDDAPGVLACTLCNARRCDEEQKTIPYELRRKASLALAAALKQRQELNAQREKARPKVPSFEAWLLPGPKLEEMWPIDKSTTA